MTPRELTERLKRAGIENAAGEAAYLASSFCGVDFAHFPLAKDLSGKALERAVSRREAGEPLQYIIGKWRFMNEEYEVTPAVLIPRQDTEILVEWAINNIPRGGKFCDLGTGSGCIAVSILAARPDLTCVACDKYADALEVAKRNAARNNVSERVEFVLCDVLAEELPGGDFDAVVSNPPYVTADEYETLGRELFFEPRSALTDGGDGLTFYRAITEKYAPRLNERGVIVYEIGASQGASLSEIADAFGMSAKIIKDYSGHDRVAVMRRKEKQ